MGDPRVVVPYHDLHDDDDTLPTNIILNFSNDPNPTLLDLSNHAEFSYSSSVLGPLNDATLVGNIDPNSDPMKLSTGASGNFEGGPSELLRENHPVHQNLRAAFWQELPIPFTCTFCQVLREIVHTNGIHSTKLQIHGTLGVVSHAVHYQNTYVGSSAHHPFQIFDFSNKTIDQIKAFLVQYCLNQNSTGYCIVQDPLSSYYEALCCGLDWTEDSNDDVGDLNPDNSGGKSVKQQEVEAGDDMERIPKTCLAEQRERSGKMKLSDLRDFFSLPIEKAAKKLNLCPTVMKKICRKEGLRRWPHRKVKSIVKQISILRRAIESDGGASRRAQTEAEIKRLEQEMIQHCGGFAPTSFNFE